jgi:hypothetical protein
MGFLNKTGWGVFRLGERSKRGNDGLEGCYFKRERQKRNFPSSPFKSTLKRDGFARERAMNRGENMLGFHNHMFLICTYKT